MLKVEVFRGQNVESSHYVKAIVINSKDKVIYSTNNGKDFIYPRSSIKIFQSIPLILSGAAGHYNLNDKQIALSASSHFGEKMHIKYLSKWLKKIKIKENLLRCGVHNPLNIESSNKLLMSGKKSSELYNNCSGKHLGMITTCMYKNYSINNYVNLNHPIQKEILSILESFTETKVKNKFKSIDGCTLPQYAFSIESLTLAMLKVSCFNKLQSDISLCLNKLLYCITNNPFFIGGSNRFDSELIKITKGRIFCKQGAEGVLLFSDMKNKYGGVLKVKDGNNRAIPAATLSLLKKIGSLNINELNKLKKWNPEILFNHSNKKVGMIKYLNI